MMLRKYKIDPQKILVSVEITCYEKCVYLYNLTYVKCLYSIEK